MKVKQRKKTEEKSAIGKQNVEYYKLNNEKGGKEDVRERERKEEGMR